MVEEIDDSRTEYSDLSASDSQIDTCMDRLADDLYAVTITCSLTRNASGLYAETYRKCYSNLRKESATR